MCYLFVFRFLLLTVTSVVLVGCASDNSHDIEMRIQIIIDMIERNDNTIFKIRNASLGYHNPLKREAGDEAIRIEKWRRDYQRSKLRGSLLSYSDSVLVRFIRLPFFSDSALVNEIEYYQTQLPSADTIQLLNLFYLTLRAEKRVLDHLDSEVPGPLRAGELSLPLHLGDSIFDVMDTVVAATSVHFANFGEQSQLDFGGIICKNNDTGKALPFKFLNVENHYMLIFFPVEKGTYHIGGNATIKHYSDYGSLNLTVDKEFVVK